MRAVFSILVCLIGLASFVNGAYNDDVFFHHGKALAEVWIGRTAINVGDVTGSNLYWKMLKAVHDVCNGPNLNKCETDWISVPTHYSYQDNTFGHNWGVRDSTFSWRVEGEWESSLIRGVLANTIAHIMGDLTTDYSNCYLVQSSNTKLCNLGDFIRINLPGGQHGRNNYMHIWLRGDHVTNEFRCCPNRKVADRVLDNTGDELAGLFNMGFSRDVRCLIDHMLTCEDCGPKCDACPAQCPNVCPYGNCNTKTISW